MYLQVQRILPEWLAKPSVITSDIRNEKVDLLDVKGLDEDIVQKLKENGISHFFPGKDYIDNVTLYNCSEFVIK